VSHKERLLATMQSVRAEIEAFVREHQHEPDAEIGGGWTLHDAVAHVALWDRMAARKLAGTPLPEGDEVAEREPWDLDAFNDEMRARWRDRPMAAVLAEFAAAYPPVVAAVEAAREEDCAPGAEVWRVIDEDNAGHYPHHFPVGDPLLAEQTAADDQPRP
jgi:hypothetical protein